MKIKAPVITIDGPSGSGKGTVAGLLAKRLGWCLLDSGALYRLLAFAARNHGVDLTNEEALKLLAGIGSSLAGRLQMLDARSMEWTEIRTTRTAACAVCGHRDDVTPR